MPKYFIRTALIGTIFILSLSACGLLRPPEEASAPIEAIPLETTPAEATPTTAPTEVPDLVEPTPETESSDPAVEGPSNLQVYRIVPGESAVRFELDEDLRGQRVTVVGVTDQVAGELAANPQDLTTVQVGVMQINARTLLTDNDFRNRAIQNEILDTGEYEFITFTPTAITGLSGSAAPGTDFTFQVEGDLTIRDITMPVTFSVVARLDSENQISGTASTTINRADYNLNIPSVPNVANVEEQVELYIDFVANPG
jgi:polyisoprenoid-binding protein YceI